MTRIRLGRNGVVALAAIVLGVIFFAALTSTSSEVQARDTLWHDAKDAASEPMEFKFNEVMTGLVKRSLPAVVSIATEQQLKMHRRRGRGPGRGNDNMEDFFDFFFNQPFGREYKQRGMGSGFIINEEGYILSNNHVVENADEITVQLSDDEEYPAKVIGRDERSDIALIKIDAGKKLPYLPLGNSDKLEIGHMVVAMGNPLGLSHTVTQGIVSQKGRKDINPSGRRILANFIQTDASINPGNSGGPLINLYGDVVGINTAIAQGQGIGFAIPVNMAKTLLPQLLTGKVERSWIGIRIQEVTSDLADSLGMAKAEGALISDIVDGSPAQKAGLKAEDVILEFEGKPVKGPSDLSWMATTAGIDQKVTLLVWRDRKKIHVTIKLGRMPGEEAMAQGEKGKDIEIHGISVINPGKDVFKQLGIADGKGALVTKVDPNSKAARSGLMPGDVIRKVNSTLIKDARHFERVVGKLKTGRSVRLFVNRERLALFIAFRL